ncbi:MULTISPECIES: hypothetical protein [Mycobacteriaceae]|uniref:Uncharacterized protein n=2 Tax=Mycobacteroides TaxID=670516 RepID=A0A4R5PDR1_9MYCO|nr:MULTISPECIES: hypothetical protein [Mycobacteriaceae]KPG17646.1 hypothetical protein AN908_00160 [Mycobacteroides immunogenum]MCV7307706.1 hypothetical protein [Mycobacteroides immunogenum]TDH23402.1 hypothetical protein EJ571_06545 [Mycobacteroides franklinii]
MKKNLILAAVAASAAAVGLLTAPLAGADPTPTPTPGGYQDHPNPKSCADAWDFDLCRATHGKDMGQPPSYIHVPSASPVWTGAGR